MAVSNVLGVTSVLLDTGSDVIIGGITQCAIQSGSEHMAEPTNGDVYPQIASIKAQKPSASFTTKALKVALDGVGLAALDIGGLATGLTFFGQAHDDGGTRKGASLHRQYLIKEGIIVPGRLSASHQEDATLSYDVTITYDGTNNPVAESDTVSLPAAQADISRYTVGKVTIGGIVLPQVRSIELDFGFTVQSEGADSDIWDTFASIRTVQPKLTIRGIDPTWLKAANIPFAGKAGVVGDTIIYLKKRLPGGTYELDATVAHIKITCTGVGNIQTMFSGSGTGAAECDLLMTLYAPTAGGVPLVIVTASAIT